MIYTHSLCWWYHLPHNPTYPCLLYSPVCIICLCTAWKLVTQLVLWTESTSKDYIRAEHKLQSISKLFIPQVIIPNTKSTAQIVFTISKRKTRNTTTRVLEPIGIPRALNTGTFIQQGDLFYSKGLRRNRRQPQLTQERLGRGFGKMQVNGLEGQKLARKKSLAVSVACIDHLQALKREPLRSVFSSDGTLISASAAPHCGVLRGRDAQRRKATILI